MWGEPELSKLELNGVTLGPAGAAPLLGLAHARCRSQPPTNDPNVPTRIQQVKLSGSHNIPRWDVAELEYLFGMSFRCCSTARAFFSPCFEMDGDVAIVLSHTLNDLLDRCL